MIFGKPPYPLIKVYTLIKDYWKLWVGSERGRPGCRPGAERARCSTVLAGAHPVATSVAAAARRAGRWRRSPLTWQGGRAGAPRACGGRRARTQARRRWAGAGRGTLRSRLRAVGVAAGALVARGRGGLGGGGLRCGRGGGRGPGLGARRVARERNLAAEAKPRGDRQGDEGPVRRTGDLYPREGQERRFHGGARTAGNPGARVWALEPKWLEPKWLI